MLQGDSLSDQREGHVEQRGPLLAEAVGAGRLRREELVQVLVPLNMSELFRKPDEVVRAYGAE